MLTYQVSPGNSVVVHWSQRSPYKPKSNRATGFLTDVRELEPYLTSKAGIPEIGCSSGHAWSACPPPQPQLPAPNTDVGVDSFVIFRQHNRWNCHVKPPAWFLLEFHDMTVTAYIALGSNLGDRRASLDRGLELLRQRQGIWVTRISSYHETAPVGGPPGQELYLNAAAELQTELDPEELLRVLLEVEQECGRVRREKDGPRTLDLDLLLYGDLCRDLPELTIPHPRMHERLFVLAPLAEIAPEAAHPHTRQRVRDMLAARRSAQARELTGLRALVTGSTQGIGQAIALELARAGAVVVIHGRRTAAAESVVAAARALDASAHVLLCDLRDREQTARFVQQAWETYGPLDIWINNAGVDTLTGEAAKWPFERKLQELLAVDVQATVLLSRAVGERMQARGSGIILNIGWDRAETGMEGDSGQLFAASKAAVMAFSKSLALTLAPKVRVNCLAPGWIQTAWGESASKKWQDRVLRETPLGRWGTPQDVAAVARWLVSPAAAFITGQVIRIDGGVVR